MCSTALVRILGVILALGGVITIIMGVTVTTGSSWLSELIADHQEDGLDQAQKDFAKDARNAGLVFEAFIYVFGVYMLIMGVLAVQGCGAKCQGKKMCVCIFQIFQLILLILTIIMTLVPAGMYMLSDQQVTDFCAATPAEIEAQNEGADPEDWTPRMLVEGRQFIADADESVAQRSNLMCRNPCACAVADFSAWDNTESDWLAGGTVNTWADCDAAIANYNDGQTRENNKITSYAIAYYDNILQLLETEFNCQGICQPGDFWLFKGVSEGQPKAGCLPQLKAEFSGSAFAGMIVLLITCLIDLLLFICMFKQCKD